MVIGFGTRNEFPGREAGSLGLRVVLMPLFGGASVKREACSGVEQAGDDKVSWASVGERGCGRTPHAEILGHELSLSGESLAEV
jgi:hypothetical protein